MEAIKIPVKYIDTRQYVATIGYDQDAENPLEWTTPEERGAWFVMHHGRYDLPNELNADFDLYDGWEEVAQAVSGNKPYKFVLWYEHSGIAVSLRDDVGGTGFDGGIVGFIVGDDDNAIQSAFLNWKYYIEGSVYNVQIETDTGLFIDSCGGFYGDESVDDFINDVCGDSEHETIKRWEN